MRLGLGIGIPFTRRGGASFIGVLDLYPNAAMAYSLRKLRAAYTGAAVRIRRSSDNAETDIGFLSNGDFNSAAAVAFCGVGNGFVTTWYDQSGNSQNVSQALAANQSQIISSGAILTRNGKPTVRFDGLNDCYTSALNNPFTFTGGISLIHASYKNSTPFNTFETIFSAGTTGVPSNNSQRCISFGFGNGAAVSPAPAIVTDIWAPSGRQQDGSVSTNQSSIIGQYINNWSTHKTTGTSNFTRNNSDLITKSYGALNPISLNTNPIKIGVFDEVLTTSFFAGEIFEVIAFASDQNANRAGIQTNLNSYYAIY